jgi:hypothetical protein
MTRPLIVARAGLAALGRLLPAQIKAELKYHDKQIVFLNYRELLIERQIIAIVVTTHSRTLITRSSDSFVDSDSLVLLNDS